MGFWDWITGGPARRRKFERQRRDRLKADDIRRKTEGLRHTRSSRGGALHRETMVDVEDGGPPVIIPVFGIGDYPLPVYDPRKDRDPLDQDRDRPVHD